MNGYLIVLLLAIAVAVTFRMLREIKRIKRLHERGIRVGGIITGHKTRIRRTITVRPLVQFITQQGTLIEVESKIGMAIPTRIKGERVLVLYDEENPKSIMLEGEQNEAGPYIGIVLVWLLLVAALIVKWQVG